ncbi:MAG TPA: MlaD family protein [Nitrospiraceae bacterium]|nr:MlaD family protein [Nitrospiraceae bacterium]
MSKTLDDLDLTEIPAAVPDRRRGWSVQFIWIVPIVAALIGGWLVVKGILERGPTITITFKTAEGLEAGKTKIKYKNVDVGEVKMVKLSEDRHRVVATAEIVKEAEPYLVEDSRFWVVRPRVAGGQVSGLGTLFSGSYIGLDIGKSDTERREFIGLDTPPIFTADVPGRHFVLESKDLGSLGIGSPVYYRQVEVGSVVAHDLNKDGKAVTLKVFINAPYDEYVTTNTRFWNASGIDIALDATGIKVDTQSLASILIGGIAFEAPPGSPPAPPADENHTFALATNRSQAMKLPDSLAVHAMLYFKDSLRGLSIGAPVEFRGIVIGEVQSMSVEFDEEQGEFRFPVGITIYPVRLIAMVSGGTKTAQDPAQRRARWDLLVDRGLRGQLRTGSLLTGQLYVAVDFFPDAPKAHMDWTRIPPVLPTVVGSMTEVQETLSRLARTIEKVPLDQIGADLRQSLRILNRTLENADRFVKRLDTDITPAARTALEEARKTFKAAEQTIASDAPLQQDMRAMLRELSRTAQSLRALADYLERNPEALIRGKRGGGK